ncbi:hypothetical protein EMIT0162MI3_11880 [Pseudomonas chlororaphis]
MMVAQADSLRSLAKVAADIMATQLSRPPLRLAC